jgi:predicted NUDIX family NTP pyrophosphohydrolase
VGRLSAGLLLHRRGPDGRAQVLLVHPGGPFWARRDEGAWSIPKGEHGPADDAHATALREFEEELGVAPPAAPGRGGEDVRAGDLELGEAVQKGGKRVRAWARAGDLDVTAIRSNTFELEWPPRSGRTQAVPEVDRAEWFDLTEARRRIVGGQVPLLDRLEALLAEADPPG